MTCELNPVRFHRRARGLSQERLAARTGFSQRTISEAELVHPSAMSLRVKAEIARALGLPVSALEHAITAPENRAAPGQLETK
jgi:transcriptional regulator with XRE-family HTH domain